MSRTHLMTALLAAAALTAVPSASAQNYVWKGGAANNNWSQAANWINVVVPPNNGTANLLFTDAGFSGTSYVSPNMDANYSVNSLDFGGASSFNLMTDSSRTLTIGGGGITQASSTGQTISVPITLGASQAWLFTAAGDLTTTNGINTNGQALILNTAGTNSLTGAITGTGSLVLANTGTMILLSSGNTFSGGTTISSGTLQIGAGGTTGVLPGNVIDNAAFIFNRSDAVTFGGAISGTGPVTQNGTGTLTLTNAGNTYAGGTFVTAGTLKLGAVGALPTAGAVAVSNATLDLGGFNQTIGALFFGPSATVNPTVVTGAGALTLGGDIVFDAGQNDSNHGALINGAVNLGSGTHTVTINHFSQDYYDMVIGATMTGAGGLALTSSSVGYLALTAANTYGGPTFIGSGDLFIGVANALPVGTALTVNGTFHLAPTTTAQGVASGNYNQMVGSLAGNGSVQLGSATLTVNGGASTTYSGTISGTGGLTKLGIGTLTLTGPNTYTGMTTVGSGTLAIGAGGSLANSWVDVGPGAAVTITGTVNTGAGQFFQLDGTTANPALATLNIGGTLTGKETDVGNATNAVGGFTQAGGMHTLSGGLYLAVNGGGSGAYTLNGGTLSTNSTDVGYVGAGTFVQAGGMHSVNGTLDIGSNAGGTGSYTLNSGGLSTNVSVVGDVGAGTFTQAGGTHDITATLVIGNASGSTGSYTLNVGSLSTNLSIVGLSGVGTFTQAGGTHTITTHLAIGDKTGGIGTYNLNSGMLTTAFTYIGSNGIGTFDQAGGTNNAGILTLADVAGGAATYALGSGTLSTYTTTIGNGGTAVFTQTGGLHTVASILTIGAKSSALGTYGLSGDTSQLATGTTYVGMSGQGAFSQSGGTYNLNGALLLGLNSGATGSYTLSNGNLKAGTSTIGAGGIGAFAQDGGSNTVDNYLSLGDDVGGRGTYSLTSGTLSTGETDVGYFGIGKFTQTGGAHTVANNLTLADKVGTQGTYTLSGGTLSTAYSIVGSDGAGIFTQAGGSHIVASNLAVSDQAGSQGAYHLIAGTLSTFHTFLGSDGVGTFTQTGGIHSVTDSIVLGNNADGNGTYILNGGTLQASEVDGGAGTSTFYFNGGTLRDGSDSNVIVSGLTAAIVQVGGAIIDTNGRNPTVTQPLLHDAALGTIPDGGLTKRGAGKLTLTGANTYSGGTVVAGGTLSVASDANLGDPSGAVTLLDGGQLQFTASVTTGRTFNLNSSSLAPLAGNSITYNGATVNGGFLRGPGTHIFTGGATFNGVTTFNSTVLNQAGPASFVNLTNGGMLNLVATSGPPASFDGTVNQGSGSITVGAGGVMDVADFQTYGLLTLNPAVAGSGMLTKLANTGSSPMYFNGGSRTFIGTPATAGLNLAGVDLGGHNLVIAGGLFVNNGFVADSSATPGSVIVDFGALYKGAGTNFVNVITQNGGRVQAGNSPGSASFGQFTFGPGGVDNYVFAIDDATGTAGPKPDALGHVSGWGQVKAIQESFAGTMTSGDFTWTATPSDSLTFAIDTLVNPTTVGTDVSGPMADFDPTRSYVWPAVRWSGTYSGPTDAQALDEATNFDTSGFVNPTDGTFGWSLDAADQTLSLTYTPTAVPEPGTLALTSLAAIGWVRYWRRRWLAAATA